MKTLTASIGMLDEYHMEVIPRYWYSPDRPRPFKTNLFDIFSDLGMVASVAYWRHTDEVHIWWYDTEFVTVWKMKDFPKRDVLESILRKVRGMGWPNRVPGPYRGPVLHGGPG